MNQNELDIHWLNHALNLAKRAKAQGEVPVGAVLVRGEEVVGEGWNQSITSCDPTAHAEMVALRQAAQSIQNYRLVNTTLYVTLEPCAMCAGAILHARVDRLVYAAADPKAGAVASVFNLLQHPQLNHQVQVESGLLSVECSKLLQDFFKERRKNSASVVANHLG